MTQGAGREVDVVLVWHMHQPDYRDARTGEFLLPWVYLHALKDYSDMAAHLEANPQARAVVNLVPVLLDQIEDYADQFATRTLRDPLLRILARPDHEPVTVEERHHVLEQCFHANHQQMIAPFPRYQHLHDLVKLAAKPGPEAVEYLSAQYVFDLITWYHLSWTGETVRRAAPVITSLMAQGGHYTHAQRISLLECVGAVVADIIPRYRRLEERGQIELSTTPYFHPLGPLLLDFRTGQEAKPGLPLPASESYPGGAERFRCHVTAAIDSHKARFGRHPDGIWPAEGAVSDGVMQAIAASGVAWLATGEGVLLNTLRESGVEPQREASLYRPYRLPGAEPGTYCFFRDDRLSDLIGFEYRTWDGGHAATHFMHEIEAATARWQGADRPIISIILDGENAWEHYPYNGYYFLSSLYDLIGGHPAMHMTTYRDWLSDPLNRGRAAPLAHVTAGSWVYGDLTTWVGSPDKNAGWDLLVAAKQAYDIVMTGSSLDEGGRNRAARQLAVCESSDWFWWFGDYNAAQAVTSFDRVFRANLATLYSMLGLPVPAVLDVPISVGNTASTGDGTMRRSI